MTSVLRAWCNLARTIVSLPTAELHFSTRLDPRHIPDIYRVYTKPHPRYKVFGNKTLGAALVDLRAFGSADQYVASVSHKGYAGHQRRKARARGYQLREIERAAYADQIHAINISSQTRQGRPMDQPYLVRQTQFEVRDNFRYFGVMSASGQLVAYCNLGIFGNFAATDQLLGFKNSDGIMYFLLAEIISMLIAEARLEYFMYDTMLSGSAGLRDFKRRVGFAPYRVRYSLRDEWRG